MFSNFGKIKNPKKFASAFSEIHASKAEKVVANSDSPNFITHKIFQIIRNSKKCPIYFLSNCNTIWFAHNFTLNTGNINIIFGSSINMETQTKIWNLFSGLWYCKK